MRKEIDNRFIIPYFSHVTLGFKNYEHNNDPLFVIGKKYVLNTIKCDGCDIPLKEYILIKIINNHNGVDLNSVVMLQVSGEESAVFSLTKNDCQELGIEFMPRLQLFPQNMDWVKVKSEDNNDMGGKIEFDSSNLSTYPVDFKTKLIHNMVIKISHFKQISDLHVELPTHDILTQQKIMRSLSVRTTCNIGVAANVQDLYIKKNACIPFRFITSTISRCEKNEHIVDLDGCVFIELIFDGTNINGINPNYLVNKQFNDIFLIDYEV